MHFSRNGECGVPDNLRKNTRLFACTHSVASAFVIVVLLGAQSLWAQSRPAGFKFYFGAEAPPGGFVPVPPTIKYSPARGYGFDDANYQALRAGHGSICSERPFLFSVALPEGNYSVDVTLGDQATDSATTIKAESRRLLLERLHTAPGEFETRRFTVNVRAPEIASGGRVELKPGETASLDWDDRLTLEFNDTRPCLAALEITRVEDAVTVYLAGDSTVVDQVEEPWAAWGQMLPAFFDARVAVANHAESGESLKSFIRERRLDKILSTIKPGDYLFIQFAHNDQKQGSKYAGTHADAFTTYKAYLTVFVQEARSRGAIPVLVTSMHRRSFGADGRINNTLSDYPEAMRQTAAEEKVPLIDLNAMSKVLYEALGVEGSTRAFVHYPARTFPGQTVELKDDTHFNAYGAYELAKCVVQGIRNSHLDLARFLRTDAPFDPSHPDPVESVHLPASPARTAERSLEKR